MKRAKSPRRSAAYSFGQEHTIMVLQFAASVIIARLLTPEEIGIFSVAMVFVMVAHRLRNFGVSEYLIQLPDLRREDIKNALGLNIVISWSLGALLFISGDFLASFYDEKGVQEVTAILAISFFLLPASSNIIAILKREFHFGAVYTINVSAAIFQQGGAVFLAFLGFGYMSLAWAALASTVATIVVANMFRPENIPYTPSFNNLRPIVSFGGATMTSTLMETTSQNMAELALGKTQGFEDTGLYSRGNSLIRMFNSMVMSAMNNLALPYFSQIRREGRELGPTYLRIIELVTGIAFPFLSFVIIFSADIIPVLYGDQWGAAIPVSQLLAIGSFFIFSVPFWSKVYLSLGLAKSYMKIQFFSSFLQIGFVLGFSLTSIVGVAMGLAISQALIFVYLLTKLRIVLGFQWWQYFAAVGKSIAVTTITVIAILAAQASTQLASFDYPLIRLLAGMTFGAIAWLIAIRLLRHEIWGEINLFLDTSLKRRSS